MHLGVGLLTLTTLYSRVTESNYKNKPTRAARALTGGFRSSTPPNLRLRLVGHKPWSRKECEGRTCNRRCEWIVITLMVVCSLLLTISICILFSLFASFAIDRSVICGSVLLNILVSCRSIIMNAWVLLFNIYFYILWFNSFRCEPLRKIKINQDFTVMEKLRLLNFLCHLTSRPTALHVPSEAWFQSK